MINNSFKKEIDEIKKYSGQIDLINQTIYTNAYVLKAKLENSLKDLPDEGKSSSECVNLSLNREYLLFNKPKVIIFMLKIFFFEKNVKYTVIFKHDFTFSDSLILNDKLKESLIKLCDFKYSQKWRLIYRASDHVETFTQSAIQ